MRFTEYLTHLKRRKWYYIVLWIIVLEISAGYGVLQYMKLPQDRYAATGVYRAESPQIAIEWAYLARLQDDVSSKVPIEEGRFFEITVSGKKKNILVAAVNDALTASRNEQENVLEIRKPEAKLVSERRSIASQASTALTLAVVAMIFLHGIVIFRFMSNDNDEHCPGCDCRKIVEHNRA